jgi:HD-GYP domain-containing protein (c-di-GMP phosphodiesterase class II)
MSVQSGQGVARLAELVGAVSIATDLGMGQPQEHALRTCLIAVRLSEASGLDELTRRATYYVALLRYIGCTADAYEAAAFFGDEIAARAGFAVIDPGRPRELFAYLRAHVGAGASPARRAALLAGGVAQGSRGPRRAIAAHCEVARRFGDRLGLGEDVKRGLADAFERWDGKGFPAGLVGESIAMPARIVILARDVEVFHRVGGVEASVAVARGRAGSAYDPALVERYERDAGATAAMLERAVAWEDAIAAEPGQPLLVDEPAVDGVCGAFADFADLKSPYFVGHSAGVAELAEATAWRLGLDESDVVAARRAALLQDLGRVGVSNGVWDKRGALSAGEWERVRLHPYLSERILARAALLAPLAHLAGMHHERLDGSGYHRGVSAGQLGTTARILAAADVCQALREERPHRSAYSDEETAGILTAEVSAGPLDGEVVGALLAALGRRDKPPVPPRPAGLSGREVEVLRLLARGRSNRLIARSLEISPKTVGHHVEHIYEKAGVRTRAGATLFASEHGLVRW